MSAARDWAELLRVPALFTVPGDALAGAAAAGLRPNHRTLLAIGSSLCLYEAGMALNDWADRAEDAVERPERPLPSGRITPPAALAAAAALTAAGLTLASTAGRSSLAVAGALAGTVWAYDLGVKHTPAGPAAMAAARGLDLLLGATATAGRSGGWSYDRSGGRSDSASLGSGGRSHGPNHGGGGGGGGRGQSRGLNRGPSHGPSHRPSHGPSHRPSAKAAASSAGILAAHTLAVTAVSRHEAQCGSSTTPLTALAATTALAQVVGGRRRLRQDADAGPDQGPGRQALRGALTLAYLGTAAKPLFHAVLNPSPPLTQRAVGGGIRAMIPLQAALAARAGAVGTALLTAALAPAARKFARKVSVT